MGGRPLSILRAVRGRIYQDFLMQSRLEEYRELLGSLRDTGYTFITMRELAAFATAGGAEGPRTCVIRNDVDSDPTTAKAMFEIDQAIGGRSTYYFRLSTMDQSLMRTMAECGSEVGYHYEEIATYAKRHGLRTRSDVEANLPRIRQEFARNMEGYRGLVGDYPKTLASHGDFANRRLGVTNTLIIDDEQRSRFGIVAEAYDAWLMARVDCRISDASYPRWWHPESPEAALRSDPKSLYILVHPRQWHPGRTENVRLTVGRIFEGCVYALRSRGRG